MKLEYSKQGVPVLLKDANSNQHYLRVPVEIDAEERAGVEKFGWKAEGFDFALWYKASVDTSGAEGWVIVGDELGFFGLEAAYRQLVKEDWQ